MLFFVLFGCQKPLVVSHLSSENLAITRRKGAPKHYFLSKAICFDDYCRGTVGWKQKQKKRRFKGYKNPNRPQSRPIKEPVIAEHSIPVSNIDFVLHNPDIRVTIIGHTDDVGTPETNQELSENRALEVQNYLIFKGVGQSRLSSFGKGDSDPIIKGSTESDRAINRRVEFELSK